MLIHPEIFVTPDRPVVRFRDPRKEVNLDKELPRILSAQGWDVGTYFHVQFLSHDRTALLASAQFVVVEVREGLHTSEANPYQPVTKAIHTRRAEQVGDWWMPRKMEEAKQEESPGAQEGEEVAAKTDKSKAAPKRKAG